MVSQSCITSRNSVVRMGHTVHCDGESKGKQIYSLFVCISVDKFAIPHILLYRGTAWAVKPLLFKSSEAVETMCWVELPEEGCGECWFNYKDIPRKDFLFGNHITALRAAALNLHKLYYSSLTIWM